MDVQNCKTLKSVALVAPLRPLVHIRQLSGPNEMPQVSDTTDRYVKGKYGAADYTDDYRYGYI